MVIACRGHRAILLNPPLRFFFNILFSSLWVALPGPFICPVFSLSTPSARCHGVTQMETGRRPWVPAGTNLTAAAVREAQRGPDRAEQSWETVPHEGWVQIVPSACFVCTCLFFCGFFFFFLARPIAAAHFFLSFSILGTVPTCHLSCVFHPLAISPLLWPLCLTHSSLHPLQCSVVWATVLGHELCTHP